MLLHNTLMELEELQRTQVEEKKPVEIPEETKPVSEPVKRTAGRRKTTSK